jgi:hypothetical protein
MSLSMSFHHKSPLCGSYPLSSSNWDKYKLASLSPGCGYWLCMNQVLITLCLDTPLISRVEKTFWLKFKNKKKTMKYD